MKKIVSVLLMKRRVSLEDTTCVYIFESKFPLVAGIFGIIPRRKFWHDRESNFDESE